METFNDTFMPRMLNMAFCVLDFSLRQVELWEDSWHLLHMGVYWHNRLCSYTLKWSELNLCRRNIVNPYVKAVQRAAFDSNGAQWSVLLTKYYSGDKIEKKEMGGACSTYDEERCIQGFGGENWGKETTWKTQL